MALFQRVPGKGRYRLAREGRIDSQCNEAISPTENSRAGLSLIYFVKIPCSSSFRFWTFCAFSAISFASFSNCSLMASSERRSFAGCCVESFLISGIVTSSTTGSSRGQYSHYGVYCRRRNPAMSSIKRDVKKKGSSSTGDREDFSLDIQPTVRKCPSIALEGFCSGLSALPVGFIFR